MLILALVLGLGVISGDTRAQDRSDARSSGRAAERGAARSDESPGERSRDEQSANRRERRRADRLLATGISHYDAERFEEAIATFRAGYSVQPRSEFLFALAQAERRSGDCASAIVYYQRFLVTAPRRNQVRAARDQLEKCQDALRSSPTAQSQPPVAPAPPPSQTLPPAPATLRHVPWYHDTAGDLLLGSGAASVAVGIGFLATSKSSETRAFLTTDRVDQESRLADARRDRQWGLVAVGTGAALLTGAVIRFATRSSERVHHPAGHDGSRDSAAAVRELTVIPSSHGFSVGVAGSF